MEYDKAQAVGVRKKRVNKRKLLERNISMITVIILTALLFIIALFLIVFPRSKESLVEKRKLAEFPAFSISEYFKGTFTSGVATFYDDTVPYRDSLKNMGNQMKSLFGLRSSSNEVSFVNKPVAVTNKDKDKNESSASEVVNEITKDVSFAVRTKPNVKEEPDQKNYTGEEADGDYENGMLIVNQDNHWRGMELFGGGSGTKYADALNELQEKVGDTATIYSMPAPLASEFYVPSNYSEYSASQSECFDGIASKLNSSIKSINVCEVLSKHTEEPIYLRTDHHWQPLGAYYAARTFAEAANVPFADIGTYTKGANEGFVGTMYAFSGDARLLNDPESFEYYKPANKYQTYYYDTSFGYKYDDDLFVEVDTANSYLMFMGGDSQVVKITTDVDNSRKLLVVKDSYGNAEIPFYTGSFNEIYVIDMRYFEKNLVNFIKDLGITDVLFTMSSYSAVGENADNITNLINQDSDSRIVDTQITANKSEGTE